MLRGHFRSWGCCCGRVCFFFDGNNFVVGHSLNPLLHAGFSANVGKFLLVDDIFNLFFLCLTRHNNSCIVSKAAVD